MKIINGEDLIPAINTVIAVSTDDVNYTKLIQKVSIVLIEGEDSAGNYIVILRQGVRAIEINLAEVTNQPTWTNDEAGLLTALTDINSWLSVSSGIFSIGLAKITVSASPPLNPSLDDLWIETP